MSKINTCWYAKELTLDSGDFMQFMYSRLQKALKWGGNMCYTAFMIRYHKIQHRLNSHNWPVAVQLVGAI